jgi:hypothetical protein
LFGFHFSLLIIDCAHGFTLLHHAKRGGEEAKELLAYFEASGLNQDWIKI